MNDISSVKDLQLVFETDIIPLLQEYFYEDYDELQRILGSDFINSSSQEIKEEWKDNEELFVKALNKIIGNDKKENSD